MKPVNNNTDVPKTVIIAGRNESENIIDCINSLKLTDTRNTNVEFILVNDNSDDDTFELMQRTAGDSDNFKIINSTPSTDPNLKGKANAVDNAIQISTGDLILSTDADCSVTKDWIKKTSDYFTEKTGMVCGFTYIEDNNSLFALIQSIDWFYLLTLASSSSGLNKSMSCIGNNLSFSKKAYEYVGGYSSIKFSVTEDLALMRKINATGNFDILFPLDKDCIVKTKPCKNIKEIFSQKRRWFRGGIGINSLGYITGFCLYTVNILFVSGLFFIDLPLYLFLIAVKVLAELILLRNTFKIFDVKYLYKYYPLFTIYFALYGLLLPLTFIFKSGITWKKRKF